jgi:hypothetical protein
MPDTGERRRRHRRARKEAEDRVANALNDLENLIEDAVRKYYGITYYYL